MLFAIFYLSLGPLPNLRPPAHPINHRLQGENSYNVDQNQNRREARHFSADLQQAEILDRIVFASKNTRSATMIIPVIIAPYLKIICL